MGLFLQDILKINTMPRNPTSSLGKKSIKVENPTSTQPIKRLISETVFIYSFLLVILLELLSVIIWNYSSDYFYKTYWYPILGNLVILSLIAPNLVNTKRLHFCKTKKLTFWSLFGYYVLNVVTILTNCQDFIYTTLINNLFLGFAFTMAVVSIIKEDKG